VGRLTVAIPSMAILFATTKPSAAVACARASRRSCHRPISNRHVVPKINIISAASCSDNSSVTTANGSSLVVLKESIRS